MGKAKSNLPAVTTRQLPTNWREEMAKAADNAVQTESSVAAGAFIGTRAGQLSYQGNNFPDNEVNVVILDHVLENCYYPDKFDPDSPTPPVCYAFGRDEKEMKPHEKSSDPQAATCAECKWNKFETNDRGGKACKNMRRLALVCAQPLNEAALDKSELAFLKIPVTSVKGWAAYVRALRNLFKMPPLGVVTKVFTKPDPKTQFRVLFQHVEDLPDRMAQIAVARAKDVQQEIMFPYPEPSEMATSSARGTKSKKKRKF